MSVQYTVYSVHCVFMCTYRSRHYSVPHVSPTLQCSIRPLWCTPDQSPHFACCPVFVYWGSLAHPTHTVCLRSPISELSPPLLCPIFRTWAEEKTHSIPTNIYSGSHFEALRVRHVPWPYAPLCGWCVQAALVSATCGYSRGDDDVREWEFPVLRPRFLVTRCELVVVWRKYIAMLYGYTFCVWLGVLAISTKPRADCAVMGHLRLGVRYV